MNAPENAPTVGASQLRPVIQSRFRTVYCASALAGLAVIPDESVQVCVTSPPYWGLRSYLPAGHPLKAFELGTEKLIGEYVSKIVVMFLEVRRVLRGDGVLFLNLGDRFVNKDLVGLPWVVAFALRDSGWRLRSDNIWSKPNPMPESVRDRPTRSHEYMFLLSKSRKYYYDADAIKEPCSESFLNDSRWETGPTDSNVKNGYGENGAQNPKGPHSVFKKGRKVPSGWDTKAGAHGTIHREGRTQVPEYDYIPKQRGHGRRYDGFNDRWDAMERSEQCSGMRNKRSVWTVAPASYREAHFATFPPKLIEPCILAGSKPGDTVLDPFAGSGTTGQVALNHGRRALLIELNPDYIPLINRRTSIELQPELAIL